MDKVIKIVGSIVVCFCVSVIAIVLICLPGRLTCEKPYMFHVFILVCTIITSLGKILEDEQNNNNKLP